MCSVFCYILFRWVDSLRLSSLVSFPWDLKTQTGTKYQFTKVNILWYDFILLCCFSWRSTGRNQLMRGYPGPSLTVLPTFKQWMQTGRRKKVQCWHLLKRVSGSSQNVMKVRRGWENVENSTDLVSTHPQSGTHLVSTHLQSSTHSQGGTHPQSGQCYCCRTLEWKFCQMEFLYKCSHSCSCDGCNKSLSQRGLIYREILSKIWRIEITCKLIKLRNFRKE